MVKAKDLLNKETTDDPKSLSEQDKVSAAYEDITKRLAKLRGEGTAEDSEEEETDEEVTKRQSDKEDEEKDTESTDDKIDPLDEEEPDLTEKDIEKENEKEAEVLEKSGESDSFVVEPAVEDADNTDSTEEEDLGPRKTFEKSADAPKEEVEDESPGQTEPRQFKTHNIVMEDSDLPKTSGTLPQESSHDLDDLASEEDGLEIPPAGSSNPQ